MSADRFKYDAGTSGTVTVPSGRFVKAISCHAAAATSNATLTITPQGEDTDAGSAGSAIPVPGGTALAFGIPVLDPNIDELGPGTVLAFANTDSYLVIYKQQKG